MSPVASSRAWIIVFLAATVLAQSATAGNGVRNVVVDNPVSKSKSTCSDEGATDWMAILDCLDLGGGTGLEEDRRFVPGLPHAPSAWKRFMENLRLSPGQKLVLLRAEERKVQSPLVGRVFSLSAGLKTDRLQPRWSLVRPTNDADGMFLTGASCSIVVPPNQQTHGLSVEPGARYQVISVVLIAPAIEARADVPGSIKISGAPEYEVEEGVTRFISQRISLRPMRAGDPTLEAVCGEHFVDGKPVHPKSFEGAVTIGVNSPPPNLERLRHQYFIQADSTVQIIRRSLGAE